MNAMYNHNINKYGKLLYQMQLMKVKFLCTKYSNYTNRQMPETEFIVC